MSGRSHGSGAPLARLGPGLVAMAIVVAACGSTATPSPTESGPTTSAPTTPASATAAATPGATATTTPIALPSGAFDPARLTIRLESVATGLDSPVDVVNAGDGSGRLFVVEQRGRIKLVMDGSVVEAPFLDISERIRSGGERGLLGLAFAPDFPTDPRLFVDYTDLIGDTVVSSFTVPAATPDQADPASERVLLKIDQPFPNHNGGDVAFGPDGDLYVAMGDGGSGGDPMGNGQNLGTLLGKLLRIHPGAVDGSDPPYTIPPDAAYANDPSARPEIRASGLRNPWRFSFDRATGDLWIGDVGQGQWEEVDVIRATEAPSVAPNFGWNTMEGAHCFAQDTCDRAGLVLPVAEYDHSQGCAIIGGYVGRDPAEPRLYGGYLFGDSCSGNIWALDPAGTGIQTPRLVLDSGRTISSFGEDEAGRLYVTDLRSGDLLRIVPGS